ncbi:MAG: LysR family transcriptional regulator [Acidobacteria bacterium]|nr:LysR family transcriptional regulator [Acidobacteriota bacterium]MBI3658642.1 LysR family transcriptional regulator [Acidobacteriota bacterium]
MDLRLFEIFCVVYEQRSFSRAAEKLYLAQPTISQHIKTLEDYFGAKLFDRMGRQATPTRAGELLFRSGRGILDIKKSTIVAMRTLSDRLEGELVIGASSIPGEYLLPSVISQVNRRFPALKVIERILDTAAVIEAVREGGVELGFSGGRNDESGLEFQRFAGDELILIAPNTDAWASVGRLQSGDIFKYPFIIRELGSGTRQAIEKKLSGIKKKLSDLNIVAEVGSTTALKESVKTGIGIALISSLAVKNELNCGLIRTIPIMGIKRWTRDFFIVRDKRRSASPLCQAFLNVVLENTK